MILQALALCAQALLPLAPQGELHAGASRGEVSSARSAADPEQLRGLLERIESSDLERAARESASTLLDGSDAGSRPWFALGDWTLPRRSLDFHLRWTSPPAVEGSTPHALDFEREDHPFQVILRYAQALAARDVDLLVVPIPARLQVYPDCLPGVTVPSGAGAEADFPGVGAATTRLLLELSQAGVDVVDLLPVFAHERLDTSGERDPRLYLAHDRHWSPRGAALAAECVAQRLAGYGWFEGVTEHDLADAKIVVEAGRWQSNTGQLPPREHEVWFQRVLGPGGAALGGTDRASPVLVLGDSFSNYYEERGSSFLGLLSARLGFRVDAITLPGGGAAAVWRTLARRDEGLEGKKAVVWIFAVNALASRSFKRVELPEDG